MPKSVSRSASVCVPGSQCAMQSLRRLTSRSKLTDHASAEAQTPKPFKNYGYVARPNRKSEVTIKDKGFACSASPIFSNYMTMLGPGTPAPIGDITSDDALICVDLQRDFVPRHDLDNPDGGRFGVEEGDHVIGECVQLIQCFSAAGAAICASKDYHPSDHTSFSKQGGPFPAHAMQGTAGAKFIPAIAEALAKAKWANPAMVHVAFKGMHEDVESFGGFAYDGDGESLERIPPRKEASLLPDEKCLACPMGTTAFPWTGALILKQTALAVGMGDASVPLDMDAPPDVFAAMGDGKDRKPRTMATQLKTAKRIFICGLALDFSVLDTALNAKSLGFMEVIVVLDATRPAYIPGVGEYGTGFLSDPQSIKSKLQTKGVKLTSTFAVTGKPPTVLVDKPPSFPKSLGPFMLHTSLDLSVRMGQAVKSGAEYHLFIDDTIADLGLPREQDGTICGICTPRVAIPKGWPGAPPNASFMCWGYKTDAMRELAKTKAGQSVFLSLSLSPKLMFIATGGFILLDADGMVVAVQALDTSHPDTTMPAQMGIAFTDKMKFRSEYVPVLRDAKRFMPVNVTYMRSAGAEEFCWISPSEKLKAEGSGEWAPGAGFLYLMKDADPVFFAVSTKSYSGEDALHRASGAV